EVVGVLEFSPDGTTLVTGSREKTIRIWDVATCKQINVLTGSNGLIRSLSFSPDGKLLASASEDGKVRLWDLTAAREMRSWEGESSGCAAFSTTVNTLVMTGIEGSVWVRDARSGKVIHRLVDDLNKRDFVIASSLAYSPDGRLIAGGYTGGLHIWEASTGKS